MKQHLAESFAVCAVALAFVATSGCDEPLADGGSVASRESPPAIELPAGVEHAGWPNYFGPLHNSQTAERDLNLDWPPAGPPELWRHRVGTGYSSPVAVGETLIVQHRVGDEEIVWAFELESGDSKWSCAYPVSYQCPYHYSSGPYSTPAIDGDRVYVFSAEGTLRCLNFAAGTLVWERPLNEEYGAELGEFPVSTSPVVDGDRLIVHVGARETGAGAVALDKHTGETLWTAGSDGPSDATPVIADVHGRRYAFVLMEENLFSIDAETGKVHWQVEFKPKNPIWNNATTPVVWQDQVFLTMFGSGSKCLRQLPDGRYQQEWDQFRGALNCQYHNLILIDGHVYGFAGSDGALWCVEVASGEVKWKWPTEKGRAMSLAVGRQIIMLFEDGYLGVLEVTSQQATLKAMTDAPVLPKKCVSAPALCGGRLILRNDEEMVCFDLRP